MQTKLIWVTPDAEQLVTKMARVSNPANQDAPPGTLLAYCVRNEHWSIFEMVSACFEIETTRDIARQILRHRSFSFQEFSQRYATVDQLPAAAPREARMQDTKNRQNSLPNSDRDLADWWACAQQKVADEAMRTYRMAVDYGVAKEQARAVLPEGLTPSRMYMSGTLRSWMHYVKLRSHPSTQLEHRAIAQSIGFQLEQMFPMSWSELTR